MKYFAYTIDLKNDANRIGEYLDYHRNSRDDVLKVVADTGVVDEKIWISGNHLFMVVIANDDWDPKELYKYAQTEPGQQWDELMRAYQQPVAEAKESEWWSAMSLVIDLDAEMKKRKMR